MFRSNCTLIVRKHICQNTVNVKEKIFSRQYLKKILCFLTKINYYYYFFFTSHLLFFAHY